MEWRITSEERGTPWGILSIVIAISGSVAVYFFFAQNYFATALFVIAPIVVVIAAALGPEEFVGRIEENAVLLNGRKYSYTDIEYFAIAGDELIIKQKNAAHKHFPMPPEHIEDIRNELSRNIEEQEHEESFGEIINRVLRIH